VEEDCPYSNKMPSKWLRDAQAKLHNEHMERIRQMQPVVDNKKPRELPMSGKKEIERRMFRDKVDKGNRLLLDRLGKALERKNIDNERKAIKFNSLEQGKKKLELKRVTMENQLLLNRIQFAQPMYDHNQWERDAEHREFYLKNMTEFPELYCPHHPPARVAFLKEQEAKKQEKEQALLAKLNKKRSMKELPLLTQLPRRPGLGAADGSPVFRHAGDEPTARGRGPFGEYRPGTVEPPAKDPAFGMTWPACPPSPGSSPTKHMQQALANIDMHTRMLHEHEQMRGVSLV